MAEIGGIQRIGLLARSSFRGSVPERLRLLAGQPPLPPARGRNAAEVSRLSATDQLHQLN